MLFNTYANFKHMMQNFTFMRNITLAFIVFSFFLISSTINAQTANNSEEVSSNNLKIGELILGIPKLTDKNLFLITEALKKIKGAQFKQYCLEQRLVLIKYDKKIFSTKDEIIEAIKRQNVQMPMFVKEGTFAEMLGCK